jgi:hypothetical protein
MLSNDDWLLLLLSNNDWLLLLLSNDDWLLLLLSKDDWLLLLLSKDDWLLLLQRHHNGRLLSRSRLFLLLSNVGLSCRCILTSSCLVMARENDIASALKSCMYKFFLPTLFKVSHHKIFLRGQLQYFTFG